MYLSLFLLLYFFLYSSLLVKLASLGSAVHLSHSQTVKSIKDDLWTVQQLVNTQIEISF